MNIYDLRTTEIWMFIRVKSVRCAPRSFNALVRAPESISSENEVENPRHTSLFNTSVRTLLVKEKEKRGLSGTKSYGEHSKEQEIVWYSHLPAIRLLLCKESRAEMFLSVGVLIAH